MNKISNDSMVDAAPGAATIPDRPTVIKWMKKDLSMAISLLNAIYTDPDMMDAVATFMLGRLENDRHKQDFTKPVE